MKTMTVFLAGYNQGEHDAYHEVWLRVFGRREDAEAFIAAHQAGSERLRKIYADAQIKHQHFNLPQKDVEDFGELPKIPQWSGKKGSKKEARKNNDPIAIEFDNRVREAMKIREETIKKYAEWRIQHDQAALEHWRQALINSGMDEARAMQHDSTYVPYYSSYEDRSYEIKELPFFGNPEDFLNALTESLVKDNYDDNE